MDLRNLVDVSPFLLFEATADSDQLESSSSDDQNHPNTSMDCAIDQHHHVDDDDDAESCSYDPSDHSSSSCVGDDLDDADDVGASFDVDDDDDDEMSWHGHGFVAEEASASVDSVSSKEVMVMNEMEKNRLFWEDCLAS